MNENMNIKESKGFDITSLSLKTKTNMIMNLLSFRLTHHKIHVSHTDLDGYGCYLPRYLMEIYNRHWIKRSGHSLYRNKEVKRTSEIVRYSTNNLGNAVIPLVDATLNSVLQSYWNEMYYTTPCSLNILITDIGSIDVNRIQYIFDVYPGTTITIIDHHEIDPNKLRYWNEKEQRMQMMESIPIIIDDYHLTIYFSPDLYLMYVYSKETSAANLCYCLIKQVTYSHVIHNDLTRKFFQWIAAYDTGDFGNWRVDRGEIAMQSLINASFNYYKKRRCPNEEEQEKMEAYLDSYNIEKKRELYGTGFFWTDAVEEFYYSLYKNKFTKQAGGLNTESNLQKLVDIFHAVVPTEEDIYWLSDYSITSATLLSPMEAFGEESERYLRWLEQYARDKYTIRVPLEDLENHCILNIKVEQTIDGMTRSYGFDMKIPAKEITVPLKIMVTLKDEPIPYSLYAKEFLTSEQEKEDGYNMVIQLDTKTKTVNLRSADDRVNCAIICRANGGGGHIRAAGYSY